MVYSVNNKRRGNKKGGGGLGTGNRVDQRRGIDGESVRFEIYVRRRQRILF